MKSILTLCVATVLLFLIWNYGVRLYGDASTQRHPLLVTGVLTLQILASVAVCYFAGLMHFMTLGYEESY